LFYYIKIALLKNFLSTLLRAALRALNRVS
jgi:hypothetical protein